MAKLAMAEGGLVVNLPGRQEGMAEPGAGPQVVHLHIHLGEAMGAAQAPERQERRQRRPLLRLGAMLGLGGAVFLAGYLTAGGQRLPGGMDPAAFAAGSPAIPGAVPAPAVTAMPPSFPPRLQQQLAERPRIVMPSTPGTQVQGPAPSGAPARNAFGLER